MKNKNKETQSQNASKNLEIEMNAIGIERETDGYIIWLHRGMHTTFQKWNTKYLSFDQHVDNPKVLGEVTW